MASGVFLPASWKSFQKRSSRRWLGPASIAFTDGKCLGATLDRAAELGAVFNGTTQEEREAYLRCPPWRDRDARCRLCRRGERAGVRNLQVRTPLAKDPLKGLEAKMDLVFIDAPCTGTGCEPGIEDYKVLKTKCPATGTVGGTAYALRPADAPYRTATVATGFGPNTAARAISKSTTGMASCT